jgi:hypothetical protein
MKSVVLSDAFDLICIASTTCTEAGASSSFCSTPLWTVAVNGFMLNSCSARSIVRLVT